MRTVIFLTLITAAGVAHAEPPLSATFKTLVDAKGTIALPADVRSSWVHLGSWAVNDDKAPGAGFHDVYTQPEAVKAFRTTGQFPDGAVIVKEIRKLKSAAMTTGPAIWAGEPAVWFVMVKDAKGRFKDNVHWANGWGWGLFEAANPKLNVSKSFAETCESCHVPAKDTDWVFTQGYPTLTPPTGK